MKKREEYDNNRSQRLKSRMGLVWCGCDHRLVGDGERCLLCKRINGRRRLKPIRKI